MQAEALQRYTKHHMVSKKKKTYVLTHGSEMKRIKMLHVILNISKDIIYLET